MRFGMMLAMVMVSACAGGSGTRADDILALTGDATAGATIYSDNCAVCHGADGTGGGGPNITGESVGDEAINVVIDGKESMTAFGDVLSDQDIADLFAYMDESVFN